jgi:arylsulfatase A-like enzyme
VPAGVINDTTVLSAVDMFPTLCKFCGAELPKDYKGDGEDLGPALLGKTPKRTKPLYWEYARNDKAFAFPKGDNRSPNLAVRDGDWKLVVSASGTGGELYHLATDPRETKDLAAEKPDVVERLKELALAWRKSLP